MRILAAGLLLSAALVLATGAEARDRIADSPHIRPATPAAAGFVADAVSQSPTVRKLAATLDQGNVVAYVHLAAGQDGQASSLRFAARSQKQRFVVITIDSSLPANQQFALLGYELQHAVEIARVPWVSNQSDVRSLMALIGWRDPSRAIGYETSAALVTQRRVSNEVGAGGSLKP